MTTVPWQGRSPSRNARMLAWLLLLLPICDSTALSHRAGLSARRFAAAAHFRSASATGWIANYDVHPVDVRDTTFDFRGQPIPARVYLPRGVGFAPGIVVVHGMHELGIDEPRLVSFARSLAASGFFVMTPLVPGIADYRVEGESADVIGTAVQSFRAAAERAQGRRAGASVSPAACAARGQRSAIRVVDRLGRFGRRILRSGARAALLRHRRSRSARRYGRASRRTNMAR